MSHTARIAFFKLAPANLQAMINLSASVKKSSLGARLVELVNLRISQINGCGLCVDMHWRDLLGQGAEPRHLNAVAAWREAPFFSEREKAALRWAEIVNGQPHSDASDEEFARLRQHLSDEEIAELSFVIVTINSWNLLNVSLRNPVPLNAPYVAAA